MGNTRNMPISFSVQTGQLHPESQKFMQVMCLPGPWSPRMGSQQPVTQASGNEGYRGIRVWHLAASALPLKISKMSIVPQRYFSPLCN